MQTDPAREARRGIFDLFIKNTKEIHTNPAREARRENFLDRFNKNTKEIQTNWILRQPPWSLEWSLESGPGLQVSGAHLRVAPPLRPQL